MKLVNESGLGKLFDANGFPVVVLEGTSYEMGYQYGALMVEHMQRIWDVIVQPNINSGALDAEGIEMWHKRAYDTCSTRTRLWFDGVAAGAGWRIENVCMLDHIFEYLIYQMKLHSFAGCTSIAAWGKNSEDGNVYIGRNLDWGPDFNKFAQVLTVRKPTDGSYKSASLSWPGISCAVSSLNEKGVYLDVHDGTSMGGSLVYKDRPSLMNLLQDIMNDAPTKDSLVSRLNGMNNSLSLILTVGDETSVESVECSSLGGNRLRSAQGESYVVVNSFLEKSWGLGQRETVSNSLRRYSNMTDRLAENEGKINASLTRDLMDLRLFNEDGSFSVGCTKPTKQDADLTNHQIVTDVANRKIWLKIPVPEYFIEWTEIDLNELWK
ncbi:C45 family autoproteolytic acyltransferase/hydolase [Sediminitomix flava]|uniref:Uncharacterized protein n=1 Tax=Sediminitomix flava TaxID=379075 RepID=A0A315Z505_SEDFL|nr:C45 family peptidase [Sediminitomix flava]PWJ38553.1 hypothetical protein BC781_107143 [Sediminitomix flava]